MALPVPFQNAQHGSGLMGVLGHGKITARPGCEMFFFRVRTPKSYTFDMAILDRATLTEAFQYARDMYPGANISVLRETEFAEDGLPLIRPTVRKEKHEAQNTRVAP